MRKNWYLVAHHAGARIFEQQGVKKQLSLIHEVSHPEGRLKNQDLVSDRPGRTDFGHHPFEPTQSPVNRVLENYARELAAYLEKQYQSKAFDDLVIVCEPKLLGTIKGFLSPTLSKHVRETLSKDLLHVSEHDMSSHLESVLLEREPV